MFVVYAVMAFGESRQHGALGMGGLAVLLWAALLIGLPSTVVGMLKLGHRWLAAIFVALTVGCLLWDYLRWLAEMNRR